MGSVGDIGTIVCKAIVGGSQVIINNKPINVAFNIKELNASAEGYILSGARPYWNVFSNNTPGQWVLASSYIDFKLKGLPPNYFGDYYFNFGEFENYTEENVIEPRIIGSASVVTTSNISTISVSADLGSYDWTKLHSSILLNPFKLGIRVYYDNLYEDSISESVYTYPHNIGHNAIVTINRIINSARAELIMVANNGQAYKFNPNTNFLMPTNNINIPLQYPAKLTLTAEPIYENTQTGITLIGVEVHLTLNKDEPLQRIQRVKGQVFFYDGNNAADLGFIDMNGTFDLTLNSTTFIISERFNARLNNLDIPPTAPSIMPVVSFQDISVPLEILKSPITWPNSPR
ncbi:MAG: hypothetical protein RSE25_04975 [Bacteroidales bacterium]